MRIVDIREQTVPISRYADPGISSGGLNTSVVAIVTDVRRDGAPVYGLSEYLRIIQMLEEHGWLRTACRPHGGHLFCLHVAAALGLGGCESNPHSFQPFGGFADGAVIEDGSILPPEAPGIGFETRSTLCNVFRSLLGSIQP